MSCAVKTGSDMQLTIAAGDRTETKIAGRTGIGYT